MNNISPPSCFYAVVEFDRLAARLRQVVAMLALENELLRGVQQERAHFDLSCDDAPADIGFKRQAG